MNRRSQLPRFWLVLMVLTFTCIFPSRMPAAPTAAETQAYAAAKKAFDDAAWERAENEFAEFTRKYPSSELRPDAVLYQAEAQFLLKRYPKVVELLSAEQAHAGGLADEYLYWIGEAYFFNTNYTGAADAFARLIMDHPASARRSTAILGEVNARAKLKEWPTVINQLRQAGGPFQELAKSSPTNEIVTRGYLLLAEAELATKNYKGAEEALQSFPPAKPMPELDWSRQYLLCRLQLASGQFERALQSCTNLSSLAVASGKMDLQAQSVAFEAGVLEQLGRLPEAVKAYENSLASNFSYDLRRKAFYKVIDLTIKQNKIELAAQKLEEFFAKFPNDKSSDLALLTLGELQLKQSYQTQSAAGNNANAVANTNLFYQAKGKFEKLVNSYTNSEFLGDAQLNLGWCFWSENKLAESQSAFSNALQLLPYSESQAVARFKMGDLAFVQNDFGAALTNYNIVLETYTNLPSVQSNLVERSLYQVARCGLAQTNLAVATNALSRILMQFPNSLLADSSALLIGQGLSRLENPASARDLFQGFLNQSPESALAPEVRFAVARSFERESNWIAAITNHDAWVAAYTNHPSLPKVEFSRALANYQFGLETNAYSLFTNFLAKYPGNELAPLANYWIGDYFWRQEDYRKAELSYQEVYNKWKAASPGVAFQALMMAGRVAVQRGDFVEATNYFTGLTSKPECPQALRLEAQFGYGDAMMGLASIDKANSIAHHETAIGIFLDIARNNSNNIAAPRAFGRVGDCYFQIATQDPAQYNRASNYYQMVIDSNLMDVHGRALAEYGLGQVLEKSSRSSPEADREKLLRKALNFYENIVYQTNLRPGEKPDLVTVERAGLDAARLAEELKLWEHALRLYDRLSAELPPLQRTLEKRKARAVESMAKEKS